ncbi:uncharacterized protein LOC135464747 isoform X2 [Liolophura sinensis]|uniref:uncharacterized protein LOC135464747 isoform X2 n=1 Tax=Liolophura sinensis TaxID=3198878 RepID=UPI00315948FB
MTFYFKPPSGTTQLQRLEKLALTRLNFLLKLVVTSGDPVKVHDLLTDISLVEDSDCLIEGTRKDRISHFVLRLAFSGRRDTREFLLKAETLLFETRFLNMNEEELSYLLHSLNPFFLKTAASTKLHPRGNHSSDDVQILQTFQAMHKQFGSWENLVECYLSGSSMKFIEVPFKFVLELVRQRSVTLKYGMAHVSVVKLRTVAMTLFETLLSAGMQKAEEKSQSAVDDPRMKALFSKLRSIFLASQPSLDQTGGVAGDLLSHTEVETEVAFYPPCMTHLHRVLREKHRLKHHSRIQYTLFLKEIGLPVHEALMFWKQEYSLVSGDKKSCCHDWHRDGSRYTYSIRHLYGLEGSRVNYRGHCCHSLQTTFGHSDSGGCPFVHFDQSHLTNLLQSEGLSQKEVDTVLKSSAKGDYQRACGEFLWHKSESIKKETINTSSALGSVHHCGSDLDSQSKSSNKLTEKFCVRSDTENLHEKMLTDSDNKYLPFCDDLLKNNQKENHYKNLIDTKNSQGNELRHFDRLSCTSDAKPPELSNHVTMTTQVSLIGDSGETELTQVCCHDNDPCKPDIKRYEWPTSDAKVQMEAKIGIITRPLEYYKMARKMLHTENNW